jgi:hypothetical protein
MHEKVREVAVTVDALIEESARLCDRSRALLEESRQLRSVSYTLRDTPRPDSQLSRILMDLRR